MIDDIRKPETVKRSLNAVGIQVSKHQKSFGFRVLCILHKDTKTSNNTESCALGCWQSFTNGIIRLILKINLLQIVSQWPNNIQPPNISLLPLEISEIWIDSVSPANM